MKRIQQPLLWSAALASALALAACGKHQDDASSAAGVAPSTPTSAPVAAASAPVPQGIGVAGVDLGNAVDGNQKIGTPTDSFTPKDTVYVSIGTTGSGSAKLDAKWTYQDGQTVNEESTTISPEAPANTAFHISKPDGFPAGSYKVDIALDGKPVASKDFTVK